jgi:gliding-associated putative ABC transporter substrate-binding component GldG
LAQFANSIDTVRLPVLVKLFYWQHLIIPIQWPRPARVELNSLQTEEDITKYNRKNIPVAVLLEGKFSSLFANRASQAQLDTLKNHQLGFLRESITPGKIIVVSDADIVMNQVSESIGPLPMGTNKYTRVGYANKDFFLTCTEYLANKNNILDAKAKDYTLRLLDVKKVEEERSFWQIINIIVPISTGVLVCINLPVVAKRKYTNK